MIQNYVPIEAIEILNGSELPEKKPVSDPENQKPCDDEQLEEDDIESLLQKLIEQPGLESMAKIMAFVARNRSKPAN